MGVVTWSISTAVRRPTRAVLIPVVSATVIYYLLLVLPFLVEPVLNTVLDVDPQHVTNAGKLARRFRVVDLHCDVLLWGGRDFAKVERHPFNKDQIIGHVDLPRLRKGNVALQVFAVRCSFLCILSDRWLLTFKLLTFHIHVHIYLHIFPYAKIVNSVPRGSNFESNAQPSLWSDSITTKAILERWSIRSWFSPKHRVLFAAERLHQVAARPDSQLSVVRTVHDLPSPFADDDNKAASGKVHGVLAVEGLSSLENDLSNVNRFYEAGVRIM